MLKLRKGYVLVGKDNKPLRGVTLLPNKHPLVRGQRHKFEEVPDAEAAALDLESDDLDVDSLSAELKSLDRLARKELLALHERYLGKPEDGVTVSELRNNLRVFLKQVTERKQAEAEAAGVVNADRAEEESEDGEESVEEEEVVDGEDAPSAATEDAELSTPASSPPKRKK